MKTKTLLDIVLLPLQVVLFLMKPLIALMMPLICMVIIANLLAGPWIGICHFYFPDYPMWTKIVMIILGSVGFFLGMELSFKIADTDLFKKYILNY